MRVFTYTNILCWKISAVGYTFSNVGYITLSKKIIWYNIILRDILKHTRTYTTNMHMLNNVQMHKRISAKSYDVADSLPPCAQVRMYPSSGSQHGFH